MSLIAMRQVFTGRLRLATEQQSDMEQQKARITVFPTVNADGTERLPLWIIGSAKTSRCFRYAGVRTASTNIKWRSNKKSWMTTKIMLEYLEWFDLKIRGRKVLLLMDNFSAHECAVKTLEQSDKQLQNIRLEFFPANSTSLYQPLDQGIIRNFKTFYRRYWLHYMAVKTLDWKNPLKEMNVLHAIR
jgi:hypothetical protein